jgi:hypothetical protein
MISVEGVIDPNQGLRIVHYACYFGKLRPVRIFIEVFGADINALDYRG